MPDFIDFGCFDFDDLDGGVALDTLRIATNHAISRDPGGGWLGPEAVLENQRRLGRLDV